MIKRLAIGVLLALLSSAALAQNPGLIYSGASPAINDCVKFINRTLVTTTGAPCSTGATFANPTAQIGLAAINGIATTAMRSDAAPALASTIVAGGPIGSATVAPIITYNAAGQLTAVSSATITPAIGSITGLGSGVATALGNTAGGAGGFALFNSTPAGANPTASVGLTAVNGSASTFMRSDGAPALDQTAAYAFSGLGATHITNSAQSTSSSTGALIVDGGVGIVKNLVVGSGASSSPIYFLMNSYKSSGSGQPAFLFNWPSAGFLAFGAATSANDSIAWLSTTNGAGGVWATSNPVNLELPNGWFGLGGSGTTNSYLTSAGSGVLQLGKVNAASPVGQILQAQGSRAGTDSNVGGANLTIASGTGTGSGAFSSIPFQTPCTNGGAATTAQTICTGFTIKGGTGITTGYAVASLPAAATAGARAHVTDALNTAACVFFSAIVAGGTTVCPVFYNGAAWVGG